MLIFFSLSQFNTVELSFIISSKGNVSFGNISRSKLYNPAN